VSVETISLIQGNTGPLWQIGVSDGAGGVLTLDANYTCQLSVPTASPAISRGVTETASNRFQVQLTPTETNNMEVGTHFVTIEVENTTLSPVPLRHEVSYKIDINPQRYSA